MQDVRFLFSVSRPRFWIYVLGPYLIGLAAAIDHRDLLWTLSAAVFGVFFTLPANLLIYGVNDIFDYETDRLNPKKAEYEMLVRPDSYRRLVSWIVVLNVPFIIAATVIAPATLPSLACFLFFSIFYSAKPVRAKAIPFVDSVFNILYVFPATFAYQMATGSFPPLIVMLAAGLWTMAMHAYSAIADIHADREANVATVATLLGARGTLLFCLVLYIASAALGYQYLGAASVLIAFVYVGMMIASLIETDRDRLFAIYRRFPLLNAAVGFAIFWIVAIKKLM